MRKILLILSSILLLATACDGSDNGKGSGNGDYDNGNFTIEVSEITASCANVQVASAEVGEYFYFDVVETEILSAFDSPIQLAESWVSDIFEMIDEYKEYGETYTFTDFLSRGEDQYFYTCMLSPETSYMVVAFCVDKEGNIGDSLSLKEFSTREVKASSNTFSISVEDGIAKVDASNKQEYYLFEIYEADELSGLSEQQIISRLIYDAIDYGIDEFVMGCGFDELDYSEYLISGTRYVACCVGYDGGATTSLTRYEFTYASAGGDDDYTSDFVPGISNISSNITFSPTAAEVIFYGDFYGKGTNNFLIDSYNEEGDEGVLFEIFVPLTSTDFTGTFHTSSEIGAVNTMMRGYEDSEYMMFGSWYYNYNTDEYAASYDGSVTLSLNGSTLNFTMEWRDENSYKVSVSYSGEYNYFDDSENVAAIMATTPSALRLLRPSHCFKRKANGRVSVAPKSEVKHRAKGKHHRRIVSKLSLR